ncbi:PUA-like domain-containing protein [Cristinia sonorae]|uniref:PUA-like domain-containing protein n=1 Tax=Cristinia sonorae TaxID=1940300 RepID=A0A8K0ULI5_9AGAR|nr:PUA-like domain-containing protein [Cristinia sonorae]
MTTYTHKSNNVSDIFGHIEGVHVGKLFKNREECKDLGVHPVTGAGIYGSPSKGAYSVVLSGGYADDVDMGDIMSVWHMC